MSTGDTGERPKRLARPDIQLPSRRGAAAPEQTPAPAARPAPTPNLPVPTQAPAAPPPAAVQAPGGLARLLDAIAKMLQPKPAQAPAAQPSEPPSFTVAVAQLAGDADGTATQHLLAVLDRPVFKVKPVAKSFQLASLEDPAAVAVTNLNTRQAAGAEDADVLVWGEVAAEGYRLRLATPAADDDRPGAFGPSFRIELPLGFGDMPAGLLLSALVAAADCSGEAQKAAARKLLPGAAQQLEQLAAKPPMQMAMGQQRSVQMVFGHVCAAVAALGPADQTGPWYDKAISYYQAAAKRLGRTDPPWEAGLIHKHVAAVLMARAEKTKDAGRILELAVSEWRLAAETLTRGAMPQEWAAVQVRLGGALYRLDLLTGQTELLREALQALQGALQVYSRTETPSRWADVMNTTAQVLEVYGDQLKSTEVLSRAVDACRQVLEVRSRERTPLAWAATMNTLGGALFLLDRHSSGVSNLREAEQVLTAALEVFQAHGAKGPAKVAAKNLAHVQKLAESRKGRQVVEPHWADDGRWKR
jgi:tetratricopeptide (TPR) repeat protein